jgi:ubiquitin fusion degradation protein 1
MFRNQRIDNYTQLFQAVPAVFAERDALNEGGQILLPQSVLHDMSTLNLVFPLQFEVKSYRGTATHCGVLEFVADEGQVVMPQWMMAQLRIEPWDMVTLSTVVLPKAEFIRLRPRQMAFTELHDPRAVLESRLSKFSVVTKGDCIAIHYCGQVFELDITLVRARQLGEIRAASIIDTEVQVDFERPADMPDSPVRPAPSATKSPPPAANVIGAPSAGPLPAINFEPVKTYKPPTLNQPGKPTVAPEPEKPSFQVFAGSGRSLSGKPSPPPAGGPSPTTTSPALQASPASGGGGRTLSGTPSAQPAAGGAPPNSSPAPQGRSLGGASPASSTTPAGAATDQFKAFGGAGRSLK